MTWYFLQVWTYLKREPSFSTFKKIVESLFKYLSKSPKCLVITKVSAFKKCSKIQNICNFLRKGSIFYNFLCEEKLIYLCFSEEQFLCNGIIPPSTSTGSTSIILFSWTLTLDLTTIEPQFWIRHTKANSILKIA